MAILMMNGTSCKTSAGSSSSSFICSGNGICRAGRRIACCSSSCYNNNNNGHQLGGAFQTGNNMWRRVGRNKQQQQLPFSSSSIAYAQVLKLHANSSLFFPIITARQQMNRRGGLVIGKGPTWWEKGLQPNMVEIKGAQHLVDSLLDAGDKLVIVDFFSPACAGCKSLHPKICQTAEMNPDVVFLQVNYEEHKSMCYSLGVHVLPFFRFYRGAHGRLCSFSCTNATLKKFRDALGKHSPERCSLGPTKGLEEKQLLALAANKDLSFIYHAPEEASLSPPPPLSPIRLLKNTSSSRDPEDTQTLLASRSGS